MKATRTYVQLIIAASIFLFSMAANAGDGMTDLEQEMLESLNGPAETISLKKINQDSNELMDSMFVDRANGQSKPKRVKEANDGMTISVRIVKRRS